MNAQASQMLRVLVLACALMLFANAGSLSASEVEPPTECVCFPIRILPAVHTGEAWITQTDRILV